MHLVWTTRRLWRGIESPKEERDTAHAKKNDNFLEVIKKSKEGFRDEKAAR